MALVAGIIAGLLVTFLLIYTVTKKPLFGSVLIIVSLFLVALSTYLYWHMEDRVENRKSKITVDEIVLSDIKHQYAYGNNYQLSFSVTNQSEKYRLQSLELKILLLNCVHSSNEHHAQNDCQTISEIDHKLKARIPIKSTKTLQTYLQLDNSVEGINDTIHVEKLMWQVNVVSGFAL